jgi:hypothetical protein
MAELAAATTTTRRLHTVFGMRYQILSKLSMVLDNLDTQV